MKVNTSEMEQDLIGLCLDSKEKTGYAVESLDGYKFSTKPLQWLWENIKNNYKKQASSTNIKGLVYKAQDDIRDDDVFEKIIEHLKGIKLEPPQPDSFQSLIPTLIKSYNKQRVLEAADKLIDVADKGDMKEAETIMTHSLRSMNRRHDRTGNSGLAEIAKRALQEKNVEEDFVRTGLSWVDRRIRGIRKSEIFLMCGITGVGKSVSMIQAGQAGIGSNNRVLHITTEMNCEAVTYRYLARFTGIPEKAIRERRMTSDQKQLLNAWLERNGDRMDDLLRIEQVTPNSGTMNDIFAAVDEMQRDKVPPKLIIIDSPDHLRSPRKYSNKLDETTNIWWDVKRLASSGYALWVTSQIARGKWENRIATPEAVADNYHKSRVADAFFSINWVYKNGKKTNRRVLYWGKYRSGTTDHILPLSCDLTRMVMITTPEDDEV